MDYWKQTVPLAELESVRQAARCTVGRLVVIIDNAIVAKGIQRGPNFKHARNAHAWKTFWAEIGDRPIEAIKIRSHQTEAEARANGVDHLHWLANARADELAEDAALRAQLPPSDVEAVHYHDGRTREVQEHLRAVAMAVAKEAANLYGPSTRLERAADARARGAEKKERLEALTFLTTHRWCETTGRCLTCLRAPSREAPKADFLATECARQPYQIHLSHVLAQRRGPRYCTACAATGSTRFSAKGLGGPCPVPNGQAPSASRQSTLTKLLAGILPYHRQAWEKRTGLELVG